MLILNGVVIRCQIDLVREGRGCWRPVCRPCNWVAPDTYRNKLAAVTAGVEHQMGTSAGQAALVAGHPTS